MSAQDQINQGILLFAFPLSVKEIEILSPVAIEGKFGMQENSGLRAMLQKYMKTLPKISVDGREAHKAISAALLLYYDMEKKCSRLSNASLRMQEEMKAVAEFLGEEKLEEFRSWFNEKQKAIQALEREVISGAENGDGKGGTTDSDATARTENSSENISTTKVQDGAEQEIAATKDTVNSNVIDLSAMRGK